MEFGQEVTFEFLKKNRVALIVRSHECVHEGFELAHSGRLITLFSASYYCGLQTNKGAFLSVGPDLQPEIQQFYAASLAEATWEVPELLQNKRLEDENVKMIIERLVDCKHSLLWQFTICDTEKTGRVSRLDWSKSLRLVLELDIPFLLYQVGDEIFGLVFWLLESGVLLLKRWGFVGPRAGWRTPNPTAPSTIPSSWIDTASSLLQVPRRRWTGGRKLSSAKSARRCSLRLAPAMSTR